MYEFQLIFLPPVVTFVGSRLLDMTDCGRSSLLLNDAKAYNKTRNTTSLARTDGMGGGTDLGTKGKQLTKLSALCAQWRNTPSTDFLTARTPIAGLVWLDMMAGCSFGDVSGRWYKEEEEEAEE